MNLVYEDCSEFTFHKMNLFILPHAGGTPAEVRL